MQQLKYAVHPEAKPQGSEHHRQAVRAIVLDGNKILMLYTKRYDDYSLPGGGVDSGESLHQALIREVTEETGASNVEITAEFGLYEELRPWYKSDADNLRMKSYCYVCRADKQLGQNSLEDYEQANGMQPVWINIFDAIEHNERVIANSTKAGLSIERETWLLKKITKELVKRHLAA